MLNLRSLIQQLDEEDQRSIEEQLRQSKAEKFLTLFVAYRDRTHMDKELQEILDVNSNAFYVLKSRLFDKVQEYLSNHISTPRLEIMRKVSAIPRLLFSEQRDIALAILARMEKELQEFDMPFELTQVYAALKKIHLHSEKLYHYTQLYNKHVAYTLAIEKAEDMLSSFMVKLSEYRMGRQDSQLEILPLQKKEMDNICNIYDSHRLNIYNYILRINYALYLPERAQEPDDEPVEDMLNDMDIVLTRFDKDIHYHYLRHMHDLLSLVYYHKFNIRKKAESYCDALREVMPALLNYQFCGFPSDFLIIKLEISAMNNNEENLEGENEALFSKFTVSPDNPAAYINFRLYLSASHYFSGSYASANRVLNTLLNEVSFKYFPHAEIEVKLFQALCLSMLNKYDQAWNLLRNLNRKIKQYNDDMSYENALAMIKVLKLQMNGGTKDPETKLKALLRHFEMLNQGPTRLLGFLKLDDTFVSKLSKVIK